MSHAVHLRTSPTNFGPHYWLSWLGCSRKAWLDELARKHRDPTLLSGINYFDIGTIFHGLKALHYSMTPSQAEKINTTQLKYVTDGGPLNMDLYQDSIREAERLYRAYRAYWGFGDLGKILYVEQSFAMHKIDSLTEVVEGAVDLVCKLGKRDLRKINLDGDPGIYIVDTKTRASPDAAEYELACHSMQFSTYFRILTEQLGDTLKGLIVDLAFKSTRPTFQRFIVPQLALQNEWQVSKHQIQIASNRRIAALTAVKEGGIPSPNIRECFKRTRTGWEFCPHYKSGTCSRREEK